MTMKLVISQRTLTLTNLSACFNGIGLAVLLIFVLETFEVFREPWGLKCLIGIGFTTVSLVLDQFSKASRRRDELQADTANS